MPTQSNIKSFQQLHSHARELHRDVVDRIRRAQKDLEQLRSEEQRLSALLRGRRITARNGASGRVGRTRRRRRTDWNALLAKLPKQFQAADLRKVPQLAEKASSELFAGVTRWIEGGMVKRKKRGVYQRVA